MKINPCTRYINISIVSFFVKRRSRSRSGPGEDEGDLKRIMEVDLEGDLKGTSNRSCLSLMTLKWLQTCIKFYSFFEHIIKYMYGPLELFESTLLHWHNTDKFTEHWLPSPQRAAQISTHFPWNKTFPIMQHTGTSTTRNIWLLNQHRLWIWILIWLYILIYLCSECSPFPSKDCFSCQEDWSNNHFFDSLRWSSSSWKFTT